MVELTAVGREVAEAAALVFENLDRTLHGEGSAELAAHRAVMARLASLSAERP